MTDNGSTPIFELRNISKAFPNVQALDDITMEVHSGNILALIGENGAGKSTLLRILNGDYQPDSGQLIFDGKQTRFGSPRDAHQAGIRVIYQEPEIVPDLTVAENLYINEIPKRFGPFVDWNALYARAKDQLAILGFSEDDIPLRTKARDLSPAQRQLVEIMRALKGGVRVLALDEPTSSLSDEETTRLFELVRNFKDEGLAIIYVSHRLREIIDLTDTTAILRDGKMVTMQPTSDLSETDMMSQMVGRPLSNLFSQGSYTQEDVVMRVHNLTSPKLKNISFDLHRGEVLGIAGLVGAGRTSLGKTIFGELRADSGTIELEGQPVNIRSPYDAMVAGISYAPEDRKGEALFKMLSVRENTSLVILERIRNIFRFINFRKEEEIVTNFTNKLQVKTPSLRQEVSKLSGGNQQKVVLARWLARSPKILILDEPTRGIDVGAKAEIYSLVDDLASEGYGIIVISSELPEILGMSDRILVMHDGSITGELSREEASEEAILQLAMSEQTAQEPNLN